MVFHSETPNPGTILIRAQKATAEWHIRHKYAINSHKQFNHQPPLSQPSTGRRHTRSHGGSHNVGSSK